jgi:hypothetical protein
MFKKLAVSCALLLFAASAFAQVAPIGVVNPPLTLNKSHYVAGVFNGPAYATWQGIVVSGNSSTGAGQSIVVYPQGAANGVVTLGDGTTVQLNVVFNTSTPVTVDFGQGAGEVFTPSSVSFGGCPSGNLGVGGTSTCATLTGTIGNTHGQSALVGSGDYGVEEAIADAANNGGGLVYWERDCGNVTMNTGAATTTITGCSVPLNQIGMGASIFVKTTITTTATYSLGFASNLTLYLNACASLTAGLNCSAKSVAGVESATGTSFALSPLLITANAASGAGVVHVKAFGYSQVSSNQ